MKDYLINILENFLGDYRKHNEDSHQISFDCPACAEDKGLADGDGKGNLEINYKFGVFKCWACQDTNNMHGKLPTLIKRYGGKRLLSDFNELSLEFNDFEDKEKRLVKFDLDNILEKINLYDTDFVKIFNFDKFQIELGLPNLIYFRDINDIYTSIIKKVFINGKSIPFNTLSFNEKEEILANIPNQVFSAIQTYVYDLSRNLNNFIIIEKNEDFNIEEINLNVLSNGIISFIPEENPFQHEVGYSANGFLQFHSDWDWLMEAVEFIENL
jgi:hypothetical protein